MRYALPVSIAFILGTGCGGGGESIEPPANGTLEVTTTTTGVDQDADGYTVQIDGGAATPIGASATARSDVAAGSHTAQLGGLSANCTVSGSNPQTVTIQGGETTAITFAVTCASTTGGLTVTAATSGEAPDPDGYSVSVDGTDRGPLGANASVTLTGLTPGSHVVGLGGIAGNCQLQGDNLRAVAVSAGAPATISFSVVCTQPAPNAGSIRVTVVTTGGTPDPDGYLIGLDGGSEPIAVNATREFTQVPPGAHLVGLSGLAANCAVDGANPRTVTVGAGQAAAVQMTVACTTPALRWQQMASGTDLNLAAVWGTSPSNVLTVGSGGLYVGRIFRYNGTAWSQFGIDHYAVFGGIWGASQNDVFAVGYNDNGNLGLVPYIARFDGAVWNSMTPPVPEDNSGAQVVDWGLRAVWGSSAQNVWAVGFYFTSESHAFIAHYDGTEWTNVVPPSPADAKDLTGVSGSAADDIHAVGTEHVRDDNVSFGVLLHFNGTDWSEGRYPVENSGFSGIWANSRTDAFAAGFVGNRGLILHYNGTSWASMELPPGTGGLSAVWGSSGSDVYAVGDRVILHYDGTRWTESTRLDQALLGVWGSSSTDVFAVGLGGTIMHGTIP